LILKNKRSFLVIAFFIAIAWTPQIYKSGDDIILLGELLIPIFIIIAIVSHKFIFTQDVFLFILPFALYLIRIFIISVVWGRVEVFEIALTIKQLEYFMVLLIGFIFGRDSKPKNTYNISFVFSLSYMFFVLYDGILKFGTFHRAGIPIKPGVASFISGFFSLLPIYFALTYIKSRKWTLLSLLIILLSYGTAILTFSRSNLIAAIVVPIIVAIVFFKKQLKKQAIIYILIPTGLILLTRVLVYLLPWTYNNFRGVSPGEILRLLRNDTSWNARTMIIKSTISDIVKNANVIETLFGFHSLNNRRVWDNQYLKLIYEVGLLGLIAYLFPFLRLARTAFNDKSASMSFGMTVLMIIIHLMIISISGEVLTNIYVIMTPIYYIFGLYLGSRQVSNKT